MAYGKIKADQIVFDNSGSDTTVNVSDLAGSGGVAPLASPTFTGTPAAPTATAGANTTQLATTAFVTGAIADLSDSAPSTLNTLNELAAALGDDANFSTTVTNNIATKLPLAGGTLTGDVVFDEAISIERVKEKVNIVTTPTTGAMTLSVKDGSVIYNTATVTGNYSFNLRGDGSTTLNSLMSTSQVLTVASLVTYGTTAYYLTGVTVDGTSSGVTVKYVGGAPSAAGTASSICASTISVIKTANATFTVLVSQAEYEA